mmetsp:Transcript_9308/g.31126  ORF Transcript_9308/g.31126 Transcript_9308/m.31126 type:complete len:220 (-) Transcript_9308:218-877(-)
MYYMLRVEVVHRDQDMMDDLGDMLLLHRQDLCCVGTPPRSISVGMESLEVVYKVKELSSKASLQHQTHDLLSPAPLLFHDVQQFHNIPVVQPAKDADLPLNPLQVHNVVTVDPRPLDSDRNLPIPDPRMHSAERAEPDHISDLQARQALCFPHVEVVMKAPLLLPSPQSQNLASCRSSMLRPPYPHHRKPAVHLYNVHDGHQQEQVLASHLYHHDGNTT